jgi:hypothetical protein
MLFGVSGMSLAAAMTLAPLYAWGRFTGAPLLEIADMLPTHGAFNAFGFALCGLLAWQRVGWASPSKYTAKNITMGGAHPTLGAHCPPAAGGNT